MRWDSSDGIVIKLWNELPRNQGVIPSSIHGGSRAHEASCSVGTRDSFFG
jgi:hypothetical protein